MAYYFDFLGGLLQRRQAVTSSVGVEDADKPIATSPTGLIDNSLLPVRKVGFSYVYTGTEGSGAGYFDDYDGKWVYLSLNVIRTIGNASSGAAIAQVWTQVLFEHLWNQYSNTQCPLLDSSGAAATRGATATADFNANRRITLPDYRGRVMGVAGTGNGLTARSKAATAGAETHILSSSEMPAHNHGLGYGLRQFSSTGNNTVINSGSDITTGNAGSGAAHNNVQPTAFEHLIISAGAR